MDNIALDASKNCALEKENGKILLKECLDYLIFYRTYTDSEEVIKVNHLISNIEEYLK
jgi:hypothetical protein